MGMEWRDGEGDRGDGRTMLKGCGLTELLTIDSLEQSNTSSLLSSLEHFIDNVTIADPPTINHPT